MQRRFRGPPTAVIVVVVAVIQVAGSAFASLRQPGHAPLDPLALALLLLGPAALAFRRRAPLVMLPVAAGATAAYLALGYAWGPVVLSFGLALVLTAAAGKRMMAWSGAAAGILVLFLAAARSGDEAAFVRALAGSSWLAILVLIGEGVRFRGERVAERHRQQAAAEQAARDEYRLALARDIHDVVAHSLSLINVRASVALHLGEKDPAQFRPALETIKAASKESLAEVRQLLGVLRDDVPLSPTTRPSLGRIAEVVDNARRAGLDVSLQADPGMENVPATVQEAAYRIVQEALTNIVRHSGAGTAQVSIHASGGELLVSIDDDGAGAGAAPEGNGITGMRERVAALGGGLELGPAPSGTGWRVRAVLPLVASAGPTPR
ncbi:histidine kinase [Arthrobacter sp. SLBN-112]|uniref:sensor histidine kinase n=1 Tax=Arthrobacter sp. SLBN-112 TaxID=2768452 RepID=UPI0027B39AAF|nr:histidine kinase [Arthrobacter sp. SLBN-112]MDQ0802043.1 signal transduction histidine kinase [Arthrobacter sp. SLBN-112]